jgi:O-antigen/teichoic acid export membrane protein
MTISNPASSAIRDLTRHLMGKQGYALVDQLMVSGSNFLTGVAIARSIGLQGFGVFTLLWTAVLFLYSTQIALIVSPMMSIGPKESEDEVAGYYGCVLSHGAVFAVVGSAMLFLLMLCSAWLVPRWGVRPLALPLAAASGCYLMQDLMRRYFYCTWRAGAALINDVVSYLGQLALLLLAWRYAHSDCALVLWITAITSFAAILLGVAMLGPVRISYGKLRRVATRHWISSKWLLGSNLLQWAGGSVFYVSAPAYLGVAAVGAMRAAQSLLNVTNIWFQSLENVIPSEAARRLHHGGVGAMLRYLRQVALRWGGLTLVFAIAVAVFANPLMRFIYGSAFQGYGYVIRWMAFICIVTVITVSPVAGLRAIEKTRPIFYANIVSTLLAFLLSVPIVKVFALRGAVGGILLCRVALLAVLEVSFRVGVAATKAEEDGRVASAGEDSIAAKDAPFSLPL